MISKMLAIAVAAAAVNLIAAPSEAARRTAVAPDVAQATSTPVIPSWIRAGTSLTYVGYSAFVSGGQYKNPVEVTVSTRTTAVSPSQVAATTVVRDVGAPISDRYSWSCTAAGYCRGTSWQFWVDPSHPTASVRGPEGEQYSLAAKGTYKDPWNRTWNATLLEYQNPKSGVRFDICYQTTTGLILYQVQSYPTEYVVEYYY